MNEKEDFTQGEIFPKLISFMVPILGALILQAMYGAVDMLVVGRFGSGPGISAVSVGSGIMNMVTFVLGQLAAGVMILLGRYLGEKRYGKLGRLIGGAVAFFLLSSLIVTLLLVIFPRPIARLMQAPEEALDLTVQYIRICGAGSLFVIFYNLISSIFRGLGNSRLPLLFVGIACLVNIVGDLLFVAVFHRDVAGAALATVLAQAVSVVLSIVIIKRRDLPFEFSKKDIRLGKEVQEFTKIGSPLAFQELLTSISFLAINAFVNRIGLDASNGYGIAQKIDTFIMLIPSALIQSEASFVAQNVGAGREDRARRGLFYGVGIGAGIGILVALLTYFKAESLAGIFSKDPAAIEMAAAYLRGLAPEAFFTGILFCLIGYLNGHSESRFAMIEGLTASLIFRLPLSYYFSSKPNPSLTQIGMVVPISSLYGIIVCLIYYMRHYKNLPNEGQGEKRETEDFEKDQTYNEKMPVVITIGRTYGAGGRSLGQKIARDLEIPFYDKEILAKTAEKTGLSLKYLEENDEQEKLSLLQLYTPDSPESLPEMAGRAQAEVIRQVAGEGGCVIVGRRADQVLRDREKIIRVFVDGNFDKRRQRVMKREGLSREEAQEKVRKVDGEREAYYQSLTEKPRKDPTNYDLSINTDRVSLEEGAKIIEKMAREVAGK